MNTRKINVILEDHEKRILELEKAIKQLKKIKVAKKTSEMDLNRDGVVDKKDASIAGKVLVNSRKNHGKK